MDFIRPRRLIATKWPKIACNTRQPTARLHESLINQSRRLDDRYGDLLPVGNGATPLPADLAVSVNANEAGLQRRLRFVSEGIIRARHTSDRREVRLRQWHTGASVAFVLLGTAGLVKTKAEALPADQMSWAFVGAIISLIFVIVLELYRVFGIEQTALRLLAAKEAFSLLEVETKHALRNDDPLPALEAVLEKAQTLEKMFHQVLPDGPRDEVQILVESFLNDHRPEGGWRLPVSQQKPKQKRGGS